MRTATADHGACSIARCRAVDIDPAGTTTTQEFERTAGIQHVNDGCDCWIIDAPLLEIVAILEQGDIPVLKIGTDDGYKLNLRAHKASLGIAVKKYVALSHVWADGLGLPYSNVIAQCQLTRIADRIGKLEATESCSDLHI